MNVDGVIFSFDGCGILSHYDNGQGPRKRQNLSEYEGILTLFYLI